jgi:hypothetical protein
MELGMFWDALKEYIKYTNNKMPIDQNLFNNVLDLYPEFLRPNIIGILNYLKKKKQNNHCDKLMIYTNNQGPVEWAKYIINYFDVKLDYNMFDQIISAFKVQGKRVELCRTTHMKTHSDLIKCTKLPEDTEICFLDDVFYPDMTNDKIYYINVKPYVHDLKFEELINRFLKSDILKEKDDDNNKFKNFIMDFLKKYHHTYEKKTQVAKNVDNILSKKILQHLHIFFKAKPSINNLKNIKNINKTKKNKIIYNKTSKRRLSI